MKHIVHNLKKLNTLLLLLALMGVSEIGWGQYSVNFDGTSDATHATDYGFTNHSLSGITWTGVQAIIPTSPLADWYNGIRSARLRGYSTSHMTMTSNKSNGIGTISFNYRRYGTDAQVTWRVDYSTNNGSTWSQVGSNFTAPANNDIQLFSETINVSGDVRIRIIHVSGGNTSTNRRLNIDDLLITDYSASTPTITVTPSSLSSFTYVQGSGPSTEQTFTVSGSNLTADISIAASTNYEISKSSGTGYTTPLTFAQTSGSVAEQTVYVRLKAGLSVGNYNNENITATSTGATNKTVTCSGSVSAPPAPNLAITGSTNHGSVCPNSSASLITYTITNNGNLAAEGISVISSDAQFVVSNLSSTTIAVGGTATYNVTFTPSSAGAKTATITVSSSTSGSNSPTSSLSGTGLSSVTAAVATSAATSITVSTATLNGNLTTLGVCPATNEKGLVYSQTSVNSNPLVDGTGVTKTSVSGLTTGAYLLALSGLNSGTEYSFKAYVYDGTTYTYGSVATFTTVVAAPVAISATSIGATGFTANWESVQGASSYRLDVANSASFTSNFLAITDDFENNNLSNWSNINDWVTSNSAPLNGTYSLKNNISGSAGSSYIYAQPEGINLNAGNTVWQFNIRPGFDPSTNNKAWFYLTANATNLTGSSTIDGYVVGVNYSGSDDYLKIWKVTNNAVDGLPVVSSNYLVSQNVTVGVEVTRSSEGLWTLRYKSGGGFSDMITAGTGTDNTYTFSNYCGLVFVYTSSNAGLLRFDNFSISASSSSILTSYDNLETTSVFQAVTNLSPELSYYYRVRAVGANSTSANSNVITVTTGANKVSTSAGDWNSITWNPAGVPVSKDDVTINHAVTLAGQANCHNLTIGTGGSLTVNSGGSLLPTGTATGTVTLERNVGEATWTDPADGWHLLSSPVTSQAISPAFTELNASDYDFYAWDEDANMWLNQKESGNEITAFSPGKGYLVSYKNGGTKSFSGTLNVADQSVSLTKKENNTTRGYNLIGNPFSSAIIWGTGWTLGNVGAVAYVWNESAKDYISRSAGDPIPAMNGFMVYLSSGTSQQLTIPASARQHNGQAWFKSSGDRIVLHAIDKSNNSYKENIIRFKADATENFDLAFDGYYLQGYAPKFYSVSNNEYFSVNTLPEVTESLIIPLGFEKTDAEEFAIEMKESIPGAIIYLTDKKTNTVTNLTQNPVYSFTAAPGDNASRFSLHFASVGLGETPATQPVLAYYHDGALYVNNTQAGAEIMLFGISGQLLKQQTATAGLNTLQAGKLSAGVYVVRVQSAAGTYSSKVIVTR